MSKPKNPRPGALPNQYPISYDHVMLYESSIAHAQTVMADSARPPGPQRGDHAPMPASQPACPFCFHCQVLREGPQPERRRYPRGSHPSIDTGARRNIASALLVALGALAVGVATYFVATAVT